MWENISRAIKIIHVLFIKTLFIIYSTDKSEDKRARQVKVTTIILDVTARKETML